MAGKQGGSGSALGFNVGHVDKSLGRQAEVFRFCHASTNNGASDGMSSDKPTENTVLKGILVEKQSEKERRD